MDVDQVTIINKNSGNCMTLFPNQYSLFFFIIKNNKLFFTHLMVYLTIDVFKSYVEK